MLRVIKTSQANKTAGIAVTYRAGSRHRFGTCLANCSLNNEPSYSTNKIDFNYLYTLLKAVPKKGLSFTYTHFELENLKEFKKKTSFYYDLVFNNKTTTINRSADNLKQAIKIFKTGLSTVVTLPSINIKKHFTYRNIKFVRCLAEYNKNINCSNCLLCTKKNRNYVIVFYAHGNKKGLINKGLKGGCYADNFRTQKVWNDTINDNNKNDISILKRFIKSLPYYYTIRHHIAGDIGKEKKVCIS
jgi:hypothetical protein